MSAAVSCSRRGGQDLVLARRQRALALGDRRRRERRVDRDAARRRTLADRRRELARGASLSRKPLAPGRARGAGSPGRPKVVRISERVSRQLARRARRRPRCRRGRASRCRAARRPAAFAARRGEDLVAALDLGDDLDVVLEREQARERAAHHRLVLGDQDADHVPARGTVSLRRKPPPGAGAGLEVRRGARCARSASPVRPLPAPRPWPPRRRRPRSRARPRRPSARTRIAQCRAPLWRTTFVVPSRTRPGEHRLDVGGQLDVRAVELAVDAGGGERRRAPVERLGEREPAVALHCLRAPRRAPAGDRLDVVELLSRRAPGRARPALRASSLLSAIRRGCGRAGRGGRARSAAAPPTRRAGRAPPRASRSSRLARAIAAEGRHQRADRDDRQRRWRRSCCRVAVQQRGDSDCERREQDHDEGRARRQAHPGRRDEVDEQRHERRRRTGRRAADRDHRQQRERARVSASAAEPREPGAGGSSER